MVFSKGGGLFWWWGADEGKKEGVKRLGEGKVGHVWSRWMCVCLCVFLYTYIGGSMAYFSLSLSIRLSPSPYFPMMQPSYKYIYVSFLSLSFSPPMYIHIYSPHLFYKANILVYPPWADAGGPCQKRFQSLPLYIIGFSSLVLQWLSFQNSTQVSMSWQSQFVSCFFFLSKV